MPLRVPQPVDLPEQLLLVHPRSGLGPGVSEDGRLTPFSVWLYLNGNELAKRQAAQREI
jgi:hypothetical protein